jgi:hypothetical protein
MGLGHIGVRQKAMDGKRQFQKTKAKGEGFEHFSGRIATEATGGNTISISTGVI